MRTPLTTIGLGVLALGLVCWLVGWQLGWIELAVVAAGCSLALVVAIPFIVGGSRLRLERTLSADRITVGDRLDVALTVTNDARTPSRAVIVDERIGDDSRPLAVPTLRNGHSVTEQYVLTPPRRAALHIGPAVVTRADPLGLMRRDVSQSGVDRCWVYPEHRLLSPVPVGFAKDLEGPTSDTSPAGDVAFHTIRQYTLGDDRRHIHWRSTAKTGELMVRHYVDNRRPHLAVLLDDDRAVFTADSYELAVSAGTSLAFSTMNGQLPLSLRIGTDTVIGERVPGVLETAMEALTLTELTDRAEQELLLSAVEFVRQETAASALVMITGHRSAESLLDVVALVRRLVRVVIISVYDDEPTLIALPDATVMVAGDLDEFEGRWEAFVR